MNSLEFGYNKVVIETPELDEEGNTVKKKGKIVADSSKRDTENIPLTEDIDEFVEKNVLPFNPLAWVDKSKTKVGYEIPFIRIFYEHAKVESAEVIATRIEEHEKSLMAKLHALFGGE